MKMKKFFCYFEDLIKKSMIFKISLTLFLILIVVLSFIFSSQAKEKKIELEYQNIVEQYIMCYINDDAAEQYNLLDRSVFQPVDEFDAYTPNPLNTDAIKFEIENIEEANDETLQKINNVYEVFCPQNGYENSFIVEKAFKYNVVLTSNEEVLHDFNLWIVLSNGEMKVCTVFEYERCVDRCPCLDIY